MSIPIQGLNEIKAYETESDAVDRQSMRNSSEEVQRKDHSKHGVGIKHLISIQDLSRLQIEQLLERAQHFKHQPRSRVLENKIVACCFYEPSTRTRLSFESAVLRLGGQVIGFSDEKVTSARKGETLEDTARMLCNYADVIVIRHPEAFSAQRVAQVSPCPVINAGDGSNEHPTQTLVDLSAMISTQGRLEGLKVGFIGDLLYGRTVHSLVKAGVHWKMKFYQLDSTLFPFPETLMTQMTHKGASFERLSSLSAMLSEVDVLYVSRIQKERIPQGFSGNTEVILTADLLQQVKPNLKILHPLPRVDEIDVSVDNTPYAGYFQQAAEAVPVRQALLESILGF